MCAYCLKPNRILAVVLASKLSLSEHSQRIQANFGRASGGEDVNLVWCAHFQCEFTIANEFFMEEIVVFCVKFVDFCVKFGDFHVKFGDCHVTSTSLLCASENQ